MRSDEQLVERLRAPMFDQAGELGDVAHEAADRITALREALTEARNLIIGVPFSRMPRLPKESYEQRERRVLKLIAKIDALATDEGEEG